MIKKNIWIMNHYAADMFLSASGRHYWFAENLLKSGYTPTIFCANTLHDSNEIINVNKKLYCSKEVNSIPFVFVKAFQYSGNGIARVLNMITFSKNLYAIARKYAIENGKPDIILASSVHPLTLVAGIQIAKKFGIPCICEVRDLWPESILAYGAINKNNPLLKLLYAGEKWIYKKADSIIMTIEGGKQYIIDKGWDKEIDLDKVNYICNGVVIDSFDKNNKENVVTDSDLDNNSFKNIVYAGSIRKVNNLGLLIDAAKIIKKYNKNIRFLIYGTGNEKEMLEKRCIDETIDNVIFKGMVKKNEIPSIVKKAYANIVHSSNTIVNKYGQSQNKLFEYLASGRPVIQTYTAGYSILAKYNAGVSVVKQNPEEIAKIILELCDDAKVEQMGLNARKAAYEYDFKVLTEKLIQIIENI